MLLTSKYLHSLAATGLAAFNQTAFHLLETVLMASKLRTSQSLATLLLLKPTTLEFLETEAASKTSNHPSPSTLQSHKPTTLQLDTTALPTKTLAD